MAKWIHIKKGKKFNNANANETKVGILLLFEACYLKAKVMCERISFCVRDKCLFVTRFNDGNNIGWKI